MLTQQMQQTIETGKNAGDVVAVATAAATFFEMAPKYAAVAALIYTVLRIGELVFKWLRALYKRKYDAPHSSD